MASNTTTTEAFAADTTNSTVNGLVTNVSVNTTTTSAFDNMTEFLSSTVQPLANTTWQGKDTVHPLTLKDETTLVSLIVMGVIVPAIFITVFLLICRQRRKDLQARRTQMLLQNAQDFALEDYTSVDKAVTPPPRI